MVETVRNSVASRRRQHVGSQAGKYPAPSPAPNGRVAVFLDLDTVLLAHHQGRYGPELGLQADLSDAIRRLFEVVDRVVVVVDPPAAGVRDKNDTKRRVDTLMAGLGVEADDLIVATCEHGDASCDCAKPGHGLIDEHLDGDFRAEDGWYIGGDQEGMVAGRNAGLRTVRIGPRGEDHLSAVHRPDYEARDLMDAANHIMVEVLSAP